MEEKGINKKQENKLVSFLFLSQKEDLISHLQ